MPSLRDEHVLADSAGHAMIGIDALRPADPATILTAKPAEEDQGPTDGQAVFDRLDRSCRAASAGAGHP